jgi:hypothetical protein
MERQQHEPETDRNPAEIAEACARAVLECDDAKNKQDRGDSRHIKAEHLNDQCRPDIPAEHDGQRGNKANQSIAQEGGGHQRGGRAALQECRYSNASKQGGKSVLQCNTKNTAEVRAKGTQDSGLHHMQSSQQQGYPASKIEEDDVSHRTDLYNQPNILAQ